MMAGGGGGGGGWRRRATNWIESGKQLNWLMAENCGFLACFLGHPVVFLEDGGIALISIRFHDNLKIICSHWRLPQCDFIFFSHESSHASEDICIEKWPAKNNVRSWFLLKIFVAVSQRFWAWRMPMLIFCFDCCSSTFKKPMVVRMVGAYFCLTGLHPLLLWRRHDDDHDDAHVTTILELIIWRRHDDDYDDAHVTTILELIIWALSSTHLTHTHTYTHTNIHTQCWSTPNTLEL